MFKSVCDILFNLSYTPGEISAHLMFIKNQIWGFYL